MIVTILLCAVALVTPTHGTTSLDEYMAAAAHVVGTLLPKGIHEINTRLDSMEERLSVLSDLERRVNQLEAANSVLVNAVNECNRNVNKLTDDAQQQPPQHQEQEQEPSSPTARHLLSTTSTTTTRPGVHLNTGTGLYFVSDGDRVAASFTHDDASSTLSFNGTLRLTNGGGMLGTRIIKVPSDYSTLALAVASIESSAYPVPGRVEIHLAAGTHAVTTGITMNQINRVGGVLIKGESSTTTFIESADTVATGYTLSSTSSDGVSIEDVTFRHVGVGNTTNGLLVANCKRLTLKNLKFQSYYSGMYLDNSQAVFTGDSVEFINMGFRGLSAWYSSSVHSTAKLIISVTGTATSSVGIVMYYGSSFTQRRSMVISGVTYGVYVYVNGECVIVSVEDTTPSTISAKFPLYADYGSVMFVAVKTPSGTRMVLHVTEAEGASVLASRGSVINVAYASMTSASTIGTEALIATRHSAVVSLDDVINETQFDVVPKSYYHSYVDTANYGTTKRYASTLSMIAGVSSTCVTSNTCAVVN